MEMKYVPRATKVDGAKVKGDVTLRLPTILEKYSYFEQFGLKIDAKGSVDMEGLDLVRVMIHLIKASEKHYQAINLVKGGSQPITTWDALISDPDCEPIVQEVANSLVNGFEPSGN